ILASISPSLASRRTCSRGQRESVHRRPLGSPGGRLSMWTPAGENRLTPPERMRLSQRANSVDKCELRPTRRCKEGSEPSRNRTPCTAFGNGFGRAARDCMQCGVGAMRRSVYGNARPCDCSTSPSAIDALEPRLAVAAADKLTRTFHPRSRDNPCQGENVHPTRHSLTSCRENGH